MESTDFGYVRELVRRRSAIVLDEEKRYLIESRLIPLARSEGLASISELVATLKSNASSDLHGKVVEAMTTNETSFFRDQQPFEALRNVLLPQLIGSRPLRELRVWCAACSTGQEPYSVAMILKEYFPNLAGWNVSILATDLSLQVLKKAREGEYNQIEINRGLPSQFQTKYFERRGLNFRVKDEIRSMIDFRPINLIESWPVLPMMDIVFMRNVLIYFDVPTKKAVLARARGQLADDGYLFLGGSETTHNLDDGLVRTEIERTGVYCHRHK